MAVTPPRRRRFLLAIASATLIGFAAAGVAAGHSEFVSSSPSAGATVAAEPITPIVLTFTEELASASHADITGPGGDKVGTAKVDPANNKRLTFTPAAALAPGTYAVAWTSVATDGDILRSAKPITFTVQSAASAPPSTPASASAPAAASLTASASASPSPSPDDVSATSTSAILPVLAAILIIAVLGLVLLRNRRPAARG
jgi:copper resistance protein C